MINERPGGGRRRVRRSETEQMNENERPWTGGPPSWQGLDRLLCSAGGRGGKCPPGPWVLRLVGRSSVTTFH